MMSNESTPTSSQKADPLSAEAQPKQTLAEALAGHIGTQHSARGDLSQNTGKAYTLLLVDKRKAIQK